MSSDTKLTADDAAAHDPASSARALIVVYAGDAPTRLVELPDGAQLTVGRAREATVVVDSDRISRIHARICRRGAALSVEDLGSRNGTWVNGVQIFGTHALASGDAISVGHATLVISVTSRATATMPRGAGRSLDEVLAAEVDRGRRYRRAFCLAMVRFGGGGEPAELDAAIDRIAARLRPMDVLVEYAPSELALVLPELDAEAGTVAARELVAAGTSGADVTITAGVAAFPGHGTTAGALIARARAALDARTTSPPEDALPSANDAIVIDPQMRRVYELVRKVADHAITVLVCGETGVGKEVIAAAIHAASQRRAGPLVRLNCASVPETLLESALFGHERGAFTGADRRRAGYFESARGGTLFLDEIGEISAAMQAKLLRVLEEHRVTRVGGTEEIEVDVRVVCATNRDLDAESRRGTFRRDLYYRINAFTILVPPLRDRRDEIVPLAEHFIAAASAQRNLALSPAAAEALRRHAWPGNVRELRNAIERAVVVCSGPTIELGDLPELVGERGPHAIAGGKIDDMRDRFFELERTALAEALAACGGNQTEAAKRLGLTRRVLIYKLEKHGLKPPPPRRPG